MFSGSLTALITPFRDGALDKPALDTLIERQVADGSHGIVACGTTGESPVLSPEEHIYIVERTVAVVKGRIPVVAGTGSNATTKTVDMTRAALKAGADAALIVTPYYNKPTQEGLYAHYRTVAEAVNIPIIVYNVPGRCGVDIKTETVARLVALPNIVGLKDATADMTRPKQLASLAGHEFCQLSGDDCTTIAFLEQGGHGSISVTSNVAVTLCAQMHNLWRAGKKSEAQSIENNLMPLNKALFAETSPSPAKYALSAMGYCTDEMRLPLLPASPQARQLVDDALKTLGLTQNNSAAPARHSYA